MKLHTPASDRCVEGFNHGIVVVTDAESRGGIPDAVNVDPAFGADDAGPVRPGAVTRRKGLGDSARGIAEDRGNRRGSSRFPERGRSPDRGGLARNVSCKGNRIDPKGQQSATAQLQRAQAVLGILPFLPRSGRRASHSYRPGKAVPCTCVLAAAHGNVGAIVSAWISG